MVFYNQTCAMQGANIFNGYGETVLIFLRKMVNSQKFALFKGIIANFHTNTGLGY